jgi:hypothetical protein
MKTVKWTISTGYPTASHKGEFEVEDDATEDEINEMVLCEVWNRIEYNWTVDGEER